MSAVMGIDPGVRGSLTILGAGGFIVHQEVFQPGMTHTALVAAIRLGLNKLHDIDGKHVFVEKVGYMPGDGGKGANTFGRVDGLIRGAVIMWQLELGHGILLDVLPMMWQAKLGCLSGGNKNVTKARAAELWPNVRWTHASADSALIAKYGQVTLAEKGWP